MPANLENSAALIGLEKVSFHPNPKEGQCLRKFKLPYNCAYFTSQQDYAQNSSSQASAEHEPKTSRCQAVFRKGRGTRDQIANICWIIEKVREFQKSIYFSFIDYAKAFVWITATYLLQGHNLMYSIDSQRYEPLFNIYQCVMYFYLLAIQQFLFSFHPNLERDPEQGSSHLNYHIC